MKTVIHWFRRDLRVSDNTALHEAYSRSEQVIPCFCWDEAILRAPDVGAARVAFLLRSLESLARNLEALGHRLIIRHGPPLAEIRRLALETGATAVFVNRDYEPYARQRDAEVSSALGEVGIGFHSFKDSVVWEDREVLTGAGGVYTVFTPYSKAWKSRAVQPPRPRLGPAKHTMPSEWRSLPLPPDADALGHPLSQDLFPAGERAAQQALDRFLEHGILGYAEGRNFPGLEVGTSRLSPHLRFGTINVRTLHARREEVRRSTESPVGLKGCDVWLNELIWREFYIQILANHPRVAQASFRPEYDQLEWAGGDDWFEAWCAGQTGFPVVDAAMRCLRSTGWIHNRLRMIVAMFLTKDLLVSWQRGERWFMRQLVDGDLAANNGGWQWSAGTGTDAAPYFRIFNPVTQGRRFDPEGQFIRQWVPELRDATADSLHAPWEEPLTAYRGGYVRPIVDHAVQRERCLAMFKAVRA